MKLDRGRSLDDMACAEVKLGGEISGDGDAEIGVNSTSKHEVKLH